MNVKVAPRTRVQTVFFVLMSALALASVLFSCQALYSERQRIASGYGDYVIFYTGAQIIRDGEASNLYDLKRQRDYQYKFAVPIRAGALPFNHPAYELLWHIPLTFVSYLEAYVIWNAVNIALLLGLARWFVPRHRADLKWMSWLMVFGFFPVLAVFLQGQDSILLMFLIGASMIALKRHNELAAGVLLALASFKPQLVLPIALSWLCKPYHKAAGAWLVSATILAIISVSMVGIPGTKKYLELISWIDRTNYTISPAIMPNLRGLFYALLAGRFSGAVFPLTVLATLGVLIYLVYLWRRVDMANEMVFDLTVALTLTLATLTSYHAYTHDFALLLLPALIVTRYFFAGGARGVVPNLLFAVLLILWIPFPFSYGPLLQKEQLAWGSLVVIGFAALIAKQLEFVRSLNSK